MDNLLIWLLIFASLTWFLTARRRRARAGRSDEASVRAALQSYRSVDGTQVALGALGLELGLPAGSWQALRLEDVPQPARRRLVLSIGFAPAQIAEAQLERLLWALAGRLQDAGAAHAVVVEAFADDDVSAAAAGGGAMRLLLAPDGRGWSGDEPVIAALDGAHGAQPLALGEVHRRLRATLDVTALEG